jgi:WD40 repeat protein
MPTATRTFRVFVSSTFEDLKAARDALQNSVFPKLRKLCEENSARFQAIDLRWGVRDEAALDQQTMEICLREIERCQQTRIKPNFIVLLGDRYGWRPLPARIEAQEFDRVCGHVADAADRQFVNAWYVRNDNAVPPEYLLKARTGEFVDNDRWGEIEQKLHRILREAARDAGLTQESRIKYEVSATHQEILKGLGGTDEDRKHVFAFFREPAPGIAEDPDLTALKKYLREELGEGNIRPFPASDSAKLCADVEELLSKVILAEAGTFKSRPALDLEIEAHEAFARDRARHFTGRKGVLDAIDAHLRGGESRPLVVHGPSGCGKSAIVAKASAQAKAEMPGAVLIQRFIGVTPDSSSGITLLHSLCEQLSREYGATEDTPMGFQPLVVAFHERMARATAERPLVLFLDALDQLRSDDEARSFTWLRQNLPPHVSLVVSTPEIPAGLENASRLVVEDFPASEAEEVLAAWLQDAHRKLQPEQREKVLSGFARSGLPLYLKLAFEEARRWRSFQAAERCELGNDVGGMIDVLFHRLSEEANHGPIMVNRSLGFLAATRNGLTEDEMLDVLAADDEVWKDFASRARHTPPARQLPVIVWSRLFLDLEPYLNERAVPGGNVMAFYHRQVAERAAWLYLQEDEGTLRHAALAKYFGDQSHWRNQAAMQANERKITELVRHQIGANALADLETTLTDLDFIAAKCAADLVVDLQLDYRNAIAALPEAQADLKEDARRQRETARWTEDIIEYARQWSDRRDRLARGEKVEVWEPTLPQPVRSVEPWSEERIEQEAERIRTDPARLDRLRAFEGFVRQETSALKEFGSRPGFTVQQAFNHAPRGPAHMAAAHAMPNVAAPLLARHWFPRDQYNPKPSLVRTLEGHLKGVTCVSMTPDSRRAVSGSEDDTLRVWDLETGACLRVLEGHTSHVQSVSVTPDSRLAVSASGDKTLRVWELETGACLHVLEGHTDWVTSVSLTPDGRHAVSGSGFFMEKKDNTVRLWDLETGACPLVLGGHSERVISVSMTPDSQRAVSASADKTVRVWDLETGACLLVLEGSYGVNGVCITADQQRAIGAIDDGTVRVWDLATGVCLRILEGHAGAVVSVSVTPDSRYVVSAGFYDQTVRVWSMETGLCLRVLEGHTSWVNSVSVTADGRRAVSSSADGTVRVWDLETGVCQKAVDKHNNDVTSLSVTADSQRAVSASFDQTVRVWDLATGACQRVLEGHTGSVLSVSVTPDSRRAVSASYDRTVRVWDLETGACLRILEGHSSIVNNVTVTPDGTVVVSASSDKTLRVWDLETGMCQQVLGGHPDIVFSVSVTPDSRRAVSNGGWLDPALRVWDLETGVCLHVLGGHKDSVYTIRVTADSQRAVSGSGDHTFRVWDLETGVCLQVLGGYVGGDIMDVTNDGRPTVLVSFGQLLRVWDLETGKSLVVACPPAPISALALSPVLGRIIIATSSGEVVQFDSKGLTWNSAEIIEPALQDPEAQLRRETTACLHFWGKSHPNTLLGKLGLAAVLDVAGKQREAIDIRRKVAKTCLSMDAESMAALRKEIQRLITHLENTEDGQLLLKLKNKLEDSKPKDEIANNSKLLTRGDDDIVPF